MKSSTLTSLFIKLIIGSVVFAFAFKVMAVVGFVLALGVAINVVTKYA